MLSVLFCVDSVVGLPFSQFNMLDPSYSGELCFGLGEVGLAPVFMGWLLNLYGLFFIGAFFVIGRIFSGYRNSYSFKICRAHGHSTVLQ